MNTFVPLVPLVDHLIVFVVRVGEQCQSLSLFSLLLIQIDGEEQYAKKRKILRGGAHAMRV